MPKSNPDVAYITPRVTEWAIDRSALPRSVIAEKLHVSVDRLRAWETDPESPPPFKKAQALAKILQVPFGYLFLPKPPDVALPLPDFRSLGKSYRPSLDFLQLLNDTLVKQDWFRDYLTDTSRVSRLKFIGSFDDNASVSDIARSIRTTLGITPALRNSVGSWSEYLSTLVRQAEQVGILVFRSSVVGNSTRRRISLKEVQGFAIADPIAPVVFINSADFKTAQIFTFAHEMAHLWIGQSAIVSPDEAGVNTKGIEAFCDRVAAAVLAPTNEFMSGWNTSDPKSRVQTLARRFRVSTLVVLRRAHALGALPTQEFYRLRAEELKKASKVTRPSGGDFYRNIVVRMSARLTYTLLREVNQNNIPLRDAARLLSVKLPTILKFADSER